MGGNSKGFVVDRKGFKVVGMLMETEWGWLLHLGLGRVSTVVLLVLVLMEGFLVDIRVSLQWVTIL
jgi:hypothetical protein